MLRLVSLLLHAYIGARLLPSLLSRPTVFALLAALLLASLLLMPMGVGLLVRRPLRLVDAGRLSLAGWLGWILMGLFSSLFVLTLGRDIMLLAAAGLDLLRPGSIGGTMLDLLNVDSALGVVLVSLLVTLFGFANARRTAAIVEVEVALSGLPPALHGFRIAQISDVHVGPTIRHSYMSRIVEAVNRLDADLIAITGDLVDGSVAELAPHVAPLTQLRSRHGTFFVTGNHEYYSNAPAWLAELRRLGLQVLENRHVVLEHTNADGAPPAQLVLAGVNDFGAGHFDATQRSDAGQAIAGAPSSAAVRILLAHQPRSAPAAADAGFDLQLSGHTHGGQFFPWNFFVKLQQPYVAGMHKLRSLLVYTSRGTGYWGPPLRFGAPSEITLLRLVTASEDGAN